MILLSFYKVNILNVEEYQKIPDSFYFRNFIITIKIKTNFFVMILFLLYCIVQTKLYNKFMN